MQVYLDNDIISRAVCREEKKEGVCPKLGLSRDRLPSACSDECSSDSDCSGETKCCYNGCAYSCLKAVKDYGAELFGVDEDTKEITPVGKKGYGVFIYVGL